VFIKEVKKISITTKLFFSFKIFVKQNLYWKRVEQIIMIQKLFHHTVVLLACVNACLATTTVTCYSCANYDRLASDYTYSSTCNYPITGDQSSTCTGTYCFVNHKILVMLGLLFCFNFCLYLRHHRSYWLTCQRSSSKAVPRTKCPQACQRNSSATGQR
jgi:hypothetical protein